MEVSIDDAICLHQRGQLQRAAEVYSRILQDKPNHAGALHLLGVIRHQQGDHAASIKLIARATALNPRIAVYWSNYGLPLQSLGRFTEALDCFRRALEIQPQYAQALANLGMAQRSLGLHEAALASFGEVLKREPYHADALIKLSALLEDLGCPQEAIQLYEEGIAHAPCLHFYVNLGALFIATDRADLAVGPLQEAISVAPDCVTAIVNLGMAHASLGHDADAVAYLRKALDLQPRNADVLNRLAALLGTLGRIDEAARLYQQALAECPTAETFLRLGNLLMAAGRVQEAADAFRQAIARRSEYAEAHFNLANACEELHDADEARLHFARAAELRPEKLLWRLRGEICTPGVFENAQDIKRSCERVERVMAEWNAATLSPSAPLPDAAAAVLADGTRSMPGTLATAKLDDILEAGVFPSFGLAYHGRDQRRLKERFAAMYEPCFRDQPPPTGSGLRDRKRVGILVTRRHEGMFLQSMRGIIEQLDGERFEPVILCSRVIVKALQTRIRREGLRFVPFGDSLRDAIEKIRAAACDLIYYWEVGTDAMNYFLPFARLAPVQCTGWATMTCGVPVVSWFFSSALVESPGSQEQYTERLWQSRTLFRYQDRAAATLPAIRSEFGLPEGRRLYLCFQNPLKLHPDIDPLLGGILEADPQALVVLLSDRFGLVTRLLKERFARRIPRAAERIIFLPPQSFGDYCRLLQLADVVIDPPHYGANSSCYDIFSYNLPLVTMPGKLFVGRVTQAFYRKMGVEDLVVRSPEEYTSKAVQVATDRGYRKYVTERIAEASDVLFNDLEAVREHERFFEEVLAKHGVGL